MAINIEKKDDKKFGGYGSTPARSAEEALTRLEELKKKATSPSKIEVNVSRETVAPKEAPAPQKISQKISKPASEKSDREGKRIVTMWLDDAILEFFKKVGPGYQTRINAALGQYMEKG